MLKRVFHLYILSLFSCFLLQGAPLEQRIIQALPQSSTPVDLTLYNLETQTMLGKIHIGKLHYRTSVGAFITDFDGKVRAPLIAALTTYVPRFIRSFDPQNPTHMRTATWIVYALSIWGISASLYITYRMTYALYGTLKKGATFLKAQYDTYHEAEAIVEDDPFVDSSK